MLTWPVASDGTVTLIKTLGFAGSEYLSTLIIMSDSIVIEKEAFLGCDKLKNVIFVGNQIEVGENVFGGCDSFEKIKVKDCLSLRL